MWEMLCVVDVVRLERSTGVADGRFGEGGGSTYYVVSKRAERIHNSLVTINQSLLITYVRRDEYGQGFPTLAH